MKNIFCLLGFHDWEVLKNIARVGIEHEIFLDNNPEIDPNKPWFSRPIRGTHYYKNKVCLRCGKHVNEIKQMEKTLIKQGNTEIARQQRANSLIQTG